MDKKQSAGSLQTETENNVCRITPRENAARLSEDGTDAGSGDAFPPGQSMMRMLIKVEYAEAFSALSPIEQKVLELLYGLDDDHPTAVEDVSKALGVTDLRVRQLEAKALRKLRHPFRCRRSLPLSEISGVM